MTSDNNIIWITGANGFLGSEISRLFKEEGYNVVGTGSELSVCEQDRLQAFAGEIHPRAIINCAGIRRDATGLSNRIKAYETNALGARNVALAASTVGATMVQISSDDVYSAKLIEPVNEFDNPHPDTPYGKSKRAGEMMVRDTTDDHIIVRASWLYYAERGKFKKMLDAAAAGRAFSARKDQFAAPTSVATYVKFLIYALENGAKGTYHIATKGRTSRYDFAVRLMELIGSDPALVFGEEDPSTAENIVLESLMLEMFGVELPSWDEDLENYLRSKGLAK